MGYQTLRSGNHTAKSVQRIRTFILELHDKAEPDTSSLAQEVTPKLTAPNDHMTQRLVSHRSAVAWRHL